MLSKVLYSRCHISKVSRISDAFYLRCCSILCVSCLKCTPCTWVFLFPRCNPNRIEIDLQSKPKFSPQQIQIKLNLNQIKRESKSKQIERNLIESKSERIKNESNWGGATASMGNPMGGPRGACMEEAHIYIYIYTCFVSSRHRLSDSLSVCG